MWLWLLLLGLLAWLVTVMLWLPPSRDLVLKLGTLIDMARRANPERFRERVESLSPFVGRSFKHARIKGMLRVDLSEFGEVCQRLQREARRLDQRAHVGMLPMAVYFVAVGCWFALR